MPYSEDDMSQSSKVIYELYTHRKAFDSAFKRAISRRKPINIFDTRVKCMILDNILGRYIHHAQIPIPNKKA